MWKSEIRSRPVGQVLQVFHLSDSFLLVSDDRTSQISNPVLDNDMTKCKVIYV